MKASFILPTLAAATLLGGCIIVDADEGDISAAFADENNLGTVYGAAVHHDQVIFRVTSNGCTDESSFSTEISSRGGDRYTVSIDRKRADLCRALVPDGVEVSYSFAELGLPDGADVTVLNPIRRR